MSTNSLSLSETCIICARAVAVGPGGQGARVRFLGPGLEGLAVLHARSDSPAGEVAGQPVGPAVRGPTLQGRRQDRHQTARGESL